MVPDSAPDDDVDDPDDSDGVSEATGGERRDGPDDGRDPTPTGFRVEDERLYFVVREAVEDALLGVIGTVLLVGIGLVLVWTGGAAIFNPTASSGGRVVGLVLVLAGFYLAAATLEVIPPMREWL